MEVGNGFQAAALRGSENNDPIYFDRKTGRVRTRTNNAGGIVGGISNGENIVLRIAVKPTSSIRKPQETVNVRKESATIRVEGRHDPCICPRIVPVAEAMVALTLLDHLTRQRLLRHHNRLSALRDAIDLVDHNILLLLYERQNLVKEIGVVKQRRGKKVFDPKREQEILRKQLAMAAELRLDLRFTRELFTAIFHLAKTTQRKESGAQGS